MNANSKADRSKLLAFREQLEKDYQQHHPINELMQRMTEFIDSALLVAWENVGLSQLREICLIAVGGYGRQQLQPYSDVDVQILHRQPLTTEQKAQIEQFVRHAWDLGIEISQSVRSLAQTIELARQDSVIMSNLLERRLLIGDPALYGDLEKAMDKPTLWPSALYFEAKIKEQKTRYAKYDDATYNLEPDVKHGPGGLRDIHMINWVVNRHFGARNLADLIQYHLLTEYEYQLLCACRDFLWQVSMGLQFYYKRRESRLLFESMPVIAKWFDYEESSQNKTIERFMRHYFRTIKLVRQFNDWLLQLMRETVLMQGEDSVTDLTAFFQIRNQYIEVKMDDTFSKYPSALLEIFLVMAQHPEIKGVRASTIRLLQTHAYLIDAEYRNTPYHQELFINLLRQSNNIYEQLQRMNRYGLLARYIPGFADVVGQMQYDLFHIYTVDQHILFLLRNLSRFSLPEFRGQFPLCYDIMERITKPEILTIAALFHDIAKGRGGDHSELGALDAALFCQQHLLPEADQAIVVWLVENHLLLSQTAQRQDLYDPITIKQFGQVVGDQKYLDYLYLLTVADICATNPNLWNSWRDHLLKELYLATSRYFSAHKKSIDEDEIIQEKQVNARYLLQPFAISDDAIAHFWATMPRWYFLSESPDTIAWHTNLILHNTDPKAPLVAIRNHESNSSTEVLIATLMSPDVFVKSTTLFANFNFNIVEAKIAATLDGHCLASYVLLDERLQKIADKRLDELQGALLQTHQATQSIPKLKQKRKRGYARRIPIPAIITFSEDVKRNRTSMQIICNDRPGLLASIAKVLHKHSIVLQNAKIATLGERVEDVFSIVKPDQTAIRDENELEQLKCAILQHIEQDNVL